ncbi:MAG: homocysteine S-methyltransferase family protein, partial [Planctomycetota bacterium]
QARSLAQGGVDYISIETMMDLKEAVLALYGAKQGAPGLPVSVCMVFEKKKRGFFTAMGDKPADSAWLLKEEGADMVGANCSMGSREMLEMVGEIMEAVSMPVVMKPNAGLPEMLDGQLTYKQAPEDFADDIRSMIAQGVRLVGGCCGTDERFIVACAQVR